MAPGFCALMAFTTWNTSTTPSVLHLSTVVVAAQNMAERLTVLLYIEHTDANVTILSNIHAVYYDGVVASSSLDFGDFVNDSDKCLLVRTLMI